MIHHKMVPIQQVCLPIDSDIELYVKREDLLHPYISGNKFRKLKYNILEAKRLKKKTLLTFGGAYSNHIAATAYAAKINEIKSIGVIRGEELINCMENNPTLSFAKQNGMHLHFVSREDYKLKHTEEFVDALLKKFGDFYLVPEGGTNALAIKGCEEILNAEDKNYDYICCSVGTGGTIAGIINSCQNHQKVLGFPALKGDFIRNDICKFAKQKNWDIISDYHFGGYGKIKPELIAFINKFKLQNDIPLDPVYTGKLMYGIMDLIARGAFPNGSKILAIHTGGLQGIEGMNLRLKQKKLPLIIQ